MANNKEKDKQLKMPFGTAANRLRKLILFKLVQETKQDTCFKCSTAIKNPEELSIEHKEPWLHIDVNKFWDLDNIAFSHLKCNRPHTYGGIKLRKECPEGTSWCGKCKNFQPLDNFHNNASKRKGINTECKPCHNATTNARKKIIRAKLPTTLD